MGAKTGISWCDSTWSPLRARVRSDAAEIATQKGYTSLVQIAGKMAGHVGPHCEHASHGCNNCYSESNNSRCLPGNGTGLPFDRRSRDLLEFFVDEKILVQPLRWRTPKKIFVCSQTDLFGEWVTDKQIDRVFAVMALCPQHVFQVLTKRADRMQAYISARENSMDVYRLAMGTHILTGRKGVFGEGHRFPLPNVWLGVSCEDQATADARIPLLLQTPAAKRFVSYEPALSAVNFNELPSLSGIGRYLDSLCDHTHGSDVLGRIDQIIIGGESGPGARQFDIQWARNTVEACRDAGVSVFVKQVGSKPIGLRADVCDLCSMGLRGPKRRHGLDCQRGPVAKSRSGSDPSEWPSDLRVQEFPR